MQVEWVRQCVVCAARGRTRKLEAGHVCSACMVAIADDLTAIVDLAALASVDPVSGRGQGRTVPGSRPPINVDGVDPALTMVTDCATVLDIVEAWERLVREARGMAPYGPVSAQRAQVFGMGTSATLTGCVGFLRASLPWWEASPAYPIDDFAGEIHACRRALSRWDPDREPMGTAVRCPTLMDKGECGHWLSYHDWDERVTCPRCREVRDAATLALIAMSDGREVWLDPEAAAKWLCISERTLQRMAKRGEIERSHGRYLVRHAASHA